MTAEQNQRIKDAFESVLDSPPSERTHLIGQLCADDAAVSAEVGALLQAHTEAHGFMAASPLAALAVERGPVPPPLISLVAALAFTNCSAKSGRAEWRRSIWPNGLTANTGSRSR